MRLSLKRSEMLQKITKRLLFTYFTILLLAQFFSSCMSFRTSQQEINEQFRGLARKPVQHKIKVGDREINYAEIGNDALPVAIFVHGSPGSWNAFMGFMKDTALLAKVKKKHYYFNCLHLKHPTNFIGHPHFHFRKRLS